jgi:hypothetical protein
MSRRAGGGVMVRLKSDLNSEETSARIGTAVEEGLDNP